MFLESDFERERERETMGTKKWRQLKRVNSPDVEVMRRNYSETLSLALQLEAMMALEKEADEEASKETHSTNNIVSKNQKEHDNVLKTWKSCVLYLKNELVEARGSSWKLVEAGNKKQSSITPPANKTTPRGLGGPT